MFRSHCGFQVSRFVVATFVCDELFPVGRFLAVDYRISCDLEKHNNYMIVAGVAVAVWPLGLPLGCYVMMLYYKVPRIARKKEMDAKFRAILNYCVGLLASQGKPLHGIHERMSIHDVSHSQLFYLAKALFLHKETEPEELLVSTQNIQVRQRPTQRQNLEATLAPVCSSSASMLIYFVPSKVSCHVRMHTFPLAHLPTHICRFQKTPSQRRN